MRDDEFKQKLTEVCEWEIPKKLPGTDNSVNYSRASTDAVIFNISENIMFSEYDTNPTYAPKITKIKPQPITCEDCGRICEQGRHTEAKLVQGDHRKAWRKKCLTCGRFQNPYTGEFTLTGSMASAKWNDFLRDVKAPKAAKAKKNPDLDPQ